MIKLLLIFLLSTTFSYAQKLTSVITNTTVVVAEIKYVNASVINEKIQRGELVEYENKIIIGNVLATSTQLYTNQTFKGAIVFKNCTFRGKFQLRAGIFNSDIIITNSTFKKLVSITSNRFLGSFMIQRSKMNDTFNFNWNYALAGFNLGADHFYKKTTIRSNTSLKNSGILESHFYDDAGISGNNFMGQSGVGPFYDVTFHSTSNVQNNFVAQMRITNP